MATFLAYVANETDKAFGLVLGTMDLDNAVKLCWMPKAKVEEITETDSPDVAVTVAGESIQRKATPFLFNVSDIFLDRIGAKV